MTRVYLLFSTPLFRDAITAIMANKSGIQLVGSNHGAEFVYQDILTSHPDVVLLEADETGPTVAGVRKLLSDASTTRLITLRMDADGMRIWSQTWQPTVVPQDLVDAILFAHQEVEGESRP
jgi:DNA-binding NarL/FixJ family response regulator